MELELGLQLLLQGLPAIAQIFTTLQEEKIARLKHQQAKEIQKLSHEGNWAVSPEKLGALKSNFEQEKSWQHQLAAYNRETQLQLAAYQRETALQLPEVNKILNHWPLRLLPSQLLKSLDIDRKIPLRVLIAPPVVPLQKFGDVVQAIPELELNLAQGLGNFLSKNYSLDSQERPTEFLAGAWDSKRFHREASIKSLFEMLKSEPTLILESEIVGDYLNFRIAYWGLGQKNYSYQTIINRLPYRKIVYASAKSRALRWKETACRLLACGESLEEVKRLGGDNVVNLEILEKEEKWQRNGIDISELQLHYEINSNDFETLAQIITTCHCIVTGWVADAHHLVHYDIPPLLPQLLPELTKSTSDQQLVQEVMQTTIAGYENIFNTLGVERPLWVPELALKLAQSLACLPDRSWAKEQLNYSLKVWLKHHQVSLAEGVVSLEVVQSALTIEDQKYLTHLKECLAILGDEQGVARVCHLLNVLEDLKRRRLLEGVSLVELGKNDQKVIQAYNGLSAIEDLRRKPLLQSVSLTHTLTGYSGRAASIAFNLDGQTIASGSDDHTIKLWHLVTGELLHTFTKQSGRVLSIALSPDGKTLASSNRTSDRSCIQIWDLGNGGRPQELPLLTLPGHKKWIHSLAISPNGQILVSGGYKIKIWHLHTGELLNTLTGHKKWVYALAISPDGQILVSSGGDKIIKIWHLPTGKLLRTISGHLDWVRTVAISPDGKILASGSDDNTIKLWDLDIGKLLCTLSDHSDWVLSVAISPDGQTLISGSKDHTIKLWDLGTKKLLHTLTGHKKWVYSIAVSPDGQTLASGSEDKTIKIWRAV